MYYSTLEKHKHSSTSQETSLGFMPADRVKQREAERLRIIKRKPDSPPTIFPGENCPFLSEALSNAPVILQRNGRYRVDPKYLCNAIRSLLKNALPIMGEIQVRWTGGSFEIFWENIPTSEHHYSNDEFIDPKLKRDLDSMLENTPFFCEESIMPHILQMETSRGANGTSKSFCYVAKAISRYPYGYCPPLEKSPENYSLMDWGSLAKGCISILIASPNENASRALVSALIHLTNTNNGNQTHRYFGHRIMSLIHMFNSGGPNNDN